MSHRWLVIISGVAHLAVVGVLSVSGVWRIEQLEKPKLYLRSLGVMMPEPAPSGGPHVPVPPTIIKKPKPKPDKIVQPRPTKPEDLKDTKKDDPEIGDGEGPGKPDDTGRCFENCGETKAVAPACGDGALDASEQCDDGNTANGDGCSSTCRLEALPPPPPPVRTQVLTPHALQALRISGETQVHPSAATQSMMMRARDTSVRGSLLVCIATDGSVSSARLTHSTGYSDYDQALASAARGWQYQPYRLNGTAVPACSTVTFDYSMH
jgi:TonB family protein